MSGELLGTVSSHNTLMPGRWINLYKWPHSRAIISKVLVDKYRIWPEEDGL